MLPWAGPQNQPSPGEALAQQWWSAFQTSQWKTPYTQWHGRYPNVPCHLFHGDGWGGGADRQWSYRCAREVANHKAEWFFYVFSLQKPLTCRLLQFRAHTDEMPLATLREVQQLLARHLTARYGPAEEHSGPAEDLSDIGLPTLRWKTSEVEVGLYQGDWNKARGTAVLEFLARHRQLVDAVADDQRLQKLALADHRSDGTLLDLQLASELRPSFPNVAEMLIHDRPEPNLEEARKAIQRQIEQLRKASGPKQGAAVGLVQIPQRDWTAQQVLDSVLELLQSAKVAPLERRPALLLAADRLADRLPRLWILPDVTSSDRVTEAEQQEASPVWEKQRKELATYGLSFEKDPEAETPADSWIYRCDLLWRVWRDYGASPWGERAYLLLESHGWHTGLFCAAGSDQFREVIRHGEAFLKQRPNSVHRLRVLFAVAQAYETWWSLSQASPENFSVEPAQYRQGADTARVKAIADYEQVLKLAPESYEALDARRRLPRLELRMDTNQRRYYCVILG